MFEAEKGTESELGLVCHTVRGERGVQCLGERQRHKTEKVGH